jgi:hypothetical protein
MGNVRCHKGTGRAIKNSMIHICHHCKKENTAAFLAMNRANVVRGEKLNCWRRAKAEEKEERKIRISRETTML